MLIKLILLVLGAWVVYRLFKSYGRSVRQDQPPRAENGGDMVRCAHCGVHLPRSEAIVSPAKSPEDKSQDEFFCTNEHRQLRQK